MEAGQLQREVLVSGDRTGAAINDDRIAGLQPRRLIQGADLLDGLERRILLADQRLDPEDVPGARNVAAALDAVAWVLPGELVGRASIEDDHLLLGGYLLYGCHVYQ